MFSKLALLFLGIRIATCEGFYKEFVDAPWSPRVERELQDLGISLIDFDEDNGIAHERTRREVKTLKDVKRAKVTTSQEFIDNIVEEHNRLRDLHFVSALTYDPALGETAQYWANYLAQVSEGRTLPLLFRKGWYEIGGSIWASVGRKDANHISPTFAWYNEERWYTYGQKFCMPKPALADRHTDHFTQMIWSDTTKIGCAKSKNKSKHIYVVCHYFPAGNVRGAYQSNVPTPIRAE